MAVCSIFFFLMIRRPPRSTPLYSSAASDVYKRQGMSRAVVERCGELGAAVLPGVVTATEVMAALELGCTTVKFFPAGTSGGVKAITALAAPFGGLRFVPTGGVGPANLHEYLAVPAVAAVGGSWMVPRDLVAAGDFDRVRGLVAEAVGLVRGIREA